MKAYVSPASESEQRITASSNAQHSYASGFSNGIHDSPRQAAQRQRIGTLFGPAVQRQDVMDEELQMQAEPAVAQRQEEDELQLPEEELLQGKFPSSAAPAQRRETDSQVVKDNNTGMPDRLKANMEAMSGFDLSEVRVHRGSDKPAQLSALAYAQDNEIHLATGQEQRLPHEAWHVVQQRQGRVRETVQMAGFSVNDDAALEREADVMGAQAMLQPANGWSATPLQRVSAGTNAPAQRSGKGIASGMALGAGIGALGFFAGPLVGGITTSIGAVIGGIVGHLKTQSPLPSGAHARKDKTLSPVATNELDDIIKNATRTPEEVKVRIRQTGNALIEQGLLFWTVGGSEHCEVIVDDDKGDTYRVRVIVVIPRRPTRTPQDIDMQRGAAVHELVHAIEVVSRIGGVQNLGLDIPKVVDNDSGKVLEGRELQWSKVPEDETTAMIDTLVRQMNELVASEEESKKVHKNKLDFLWSHYLKRLDYAKNNRHEVPTVVLQLFEDIHALGDEDQLEHTEFYRTLRAARQRLIDLL